MPQDAHALKAHCVTVHWSTEPERDWWSQPTWKRLVEGTEQVVAEAEDLQVDLAFYSFNLGLCDTPQQHRRLVDDMRSPRVKVLLNPVNMMKHRTVYNTTAFLNNTFDLLGDVIIGAHAKDVSLDPSHWVIKIDEVPPGKGSLDYETFLLRMSQLDQNTVLTIEHLRDVGVSGTVASPNFVYYSTDSRIIQAKNYIQRMAQRIGVVFD